MLIPRALLLTLATLLPAAVTAHCRADDVAADATSEPVTESTPEESDKPAPEPADAGPATLEAAGLSWHADYYAAYRDAADNGRMLLVCLTSLETASQQSQIDEAIAADASVRERLSEMTLFRAPTTETLPADESEGPNANDEGAAPKRLADFGAFRELHGGAGFAIIDLENDGEPYYGHTVTALPLASGKYYRWSVGGLATALDLPAGTLSQRSLVWAVRMHPESPQSTGGRFHPALVDGALEHASYQARVRNQGHQNFSRRFPRLSAAAGSSVTEVCAESWPNQTLMDSVVDCVASWRHSSGHWRGVSRPHRAYGYDIQRGSNGIWYATGLFAD